MSVMFFRNFVKVGLVANVLVGFVCRSVSVGGEEPAISSKQFLAEAPAGWKTIQQKVLRSRFQANVHWTLPRGKNPETNYTVAFNSDGHNFRYEYARRDPDGHVAYRICAGFNPEYAFELKKPAPDRSLMLTDLELTAETVLRTLEVRPGPFAAIMVDRFPIWTIVAHPSFQLKSIAQNDACVEIDFSCDIDSGRGPVLKGGTVSFLPSINWAISKFEVEITYSGDDSALSVGEAEYSSRFSEFGIPDRHLLRSVSKDGSELFGSCEIEYSEASLGTVSEEECRLTAFGLPEPSLWQSPRRRTNLLIVLNVIGLILIVFGLWFRRRIAHRKAIDSFENTF